MTADRNTALVRRAVEEIWNQAELDVADVLFAPTYVNHGGLVPDLVRAFRAGQPAQIRYPETTRPWQFVLDALHGSYPPAFGRLRPGKQDERMSEVLRERLWLGVQLALVAGEAGDAPEPRLAAGGLVFREELRVDRLGHLEHLPCPDLPRIVFAREVARDVTRAARRAERLRHQLHFRLELRHREPGQHFHRRGLDDGGRLRRAGLAGENQKQKREQAHALSIGSAPWPPMRFA